MKLIVRIAGVLLLAGAIFGIAGVMATWAPDRSVQSLSPRWATPPSQFVEVGGMEVHLRDEGPREDNMPIVLLHGTSASLHTWDGWAQSLSGQRRVIRFDLPAFGLTGPHPANDYPLLPTCTWSTACWTKWVSHPVCWPEILWEVKLPGVWRWPIHKGSADSYWWMQRAIPCSQRRFLSDSGSPVRRGCVY